MVFQTHIKAYGAYRAGFLHGYTDKIGHFSHRSLIAISDFTTV